MSRIVGRASDPELVPVVSRGASGACAFAAVALSARAAIKVCCVMAESPLQTRSHTSHRESACGATVIDGDRVPWRGNSRVPNDSDLRLTRSGETFAPPLGTLSPRRFE